MSLIQTFPSGKKSENGGHTIINANDIVMPAQDKLKFGGDLETTDNDEDGQTEVVPHELTNAEIQEIMSTLPGTTVRRVKYSTEEQVIGEWIDGKPIYQRTYLITVPTKGNRTALVTSSVFDKIVKTEVSVYKISGAHTFRYGGSSSYNAGANSIAVYVEDSTVYMDNLSSTDYYGGGNAYVTLQYTKTTD
jgi:hypothetical protein